MKLKGIFLIWNIFLINILVFIRHFIIFFLLFHHLKLIITSYDVVTISNGKFLKNQPYYWNVNDPSNLLYCLMMVSQVVSQLRN